MRAPLAGLHLVLARTAGPSDRRWRATLAEAGARVTDLPVLEVVPPADPASLDAALETAAGCDWIVLTSGHAVSILASHGALPAGPAYAVVGPATAAALSDLGRTPTLIARPARGTALLAALAGRVRGARVLLPQAADASPRLAAGLLAAGAQLREVTAYDKRPTADLGPRIAAVLRPPSPDWVVFTSPRAVRTFCTVLGESGQALPASWQSASIGPRTSAALCAAGLGPGCEAAEPSPESLAAAVGAARGARVS